MPESFSLPPDLRVQLPTDVLDRVEHDLGARLDRDALVRKRRSVGTTTDRATWVRIEIRTTDRAHGQGFDGLQAAGALTGIAKPAWHASCAWDDPAHGWMWRADEIDLVTARPIKPGGTLAAAPDLSDTWWSTLNASLDAISAAETDRIATLHCVPMTQARLTDAVVTVFGNLIDTTVTEWAAAHADLSWANLTAPECWLLDWEDWGLAPRGLDAAMLWSNSLAVPQLATRIQQERRADLESTTGLLVQLFFCAEVLAVPPEHAGPLTEPARREADRLLVSLSNRMQ
jgi:hypothetical protein